ncbi:TonB-dependent receptor [Adhaeribacter radiodurans]|uniref:TonB-dependent receptor n=1 Tax=Adhaeribacter radiodurans TaxID=2745197 RepID=A0A7L7L367_9BACT|nr:TonB-dependent receptor [Adhaeribacter radiodurans]QMU26879.1 TonB-dependent receptor [Adhaeribacter radiodurans]
MTKLIIYTLFIFGAMPVLAQNTLFGKVVDQATQEPLIGATVYLPDLRKGAATTETGNFQIRNLPRGRFLVQISYVGYVSTARSITISGETTLDFPLAASATEINTVVITGVSASTEMRRNPVPTSVIEGTQLRQRSANNIIDAIAHSPGISQISTGAAISKPVIRGLSANRVITLNNGMRQEGQQWGDEHGIEIDEASVDRAEIVKGPGSIMYGSDAMAGVINFLAADPVEEGRIIGNVSAGYQTNNRLQAYSLFNAGNINGFNWQARLSNKQAGNYRNRYDGPVYNSGFNELNASGYIGLNKSWGFSHLNFSTFNQEVGLVEGERDADGNFLKLVPETDTSFTEQAVMPADLKGYHLDIPKQSINHRRIASQNNFIIGASRLNVNVDWQQNLRKEFGNILDENEKSLFFDLQTISYDAKYFLPEAHGWETTFGISGMHQQNKNKGVEFLIPEYQMRDAGVFAFTRKTMGALNISGGLRLDERWLTSDALYLNENEEPVTNLLDATTTKFAGFKTRFSNISGSVGGTYAFSENVSVKVNAARGFRAPNISELAANGIHEGTIRYEVGNPALNPETSFQVDAGLNVNTEHITLDISGFHNAVQQYIFAEKLESRFGGDSLSGDPNDLASTFKYVQGNARLLGGELSLDIHPHPLDWLHFENTFSLVRGHQVNQPDSTRNLPFIPATRLQSEIRINFKKVGPVFRNVYARLELEHNFRQNRFYSAFGTETATPAYSLVNGGLGTDITNGKRILGTLSIMSSNIFDVAYQNHLSRLKYAALNEVTGRRGVFNMGRNFGVRLAIPLTFSSHRH